MRLRAWALTAMGILVCAGTAAGEGAAAELEPGRVAWRKLEFTATKFLITARSEVYLAQASAESLPPRPAEAPDTTYLHPGDNGALSVIVTANLLGRHSFYQTVFDPLLGTAFFTYKRKLGRSAYSKTFWFAKDGAFLRRSAPGEGENADDPTRWTRFEDRFLAFGDGQTDGLAETAALFYLIAAAPLEKPGQSITRSIFIDGRAAQVRFEAVAEDATDVDFVRIGNGGASRVDGLAPTLAIAVGLADDSENELELLGLKKDIRVWLERQTRLPVLLQGKMDIVGTVRVRLKRAVMNATSEKAGN